MKISLPLKKMLNKFFIEEIKIFFSFAAYSFFTNIKPRGVYRLYTKTGMQNRTELF